jgi:hypothetical protein
VGALARRRVEIEAPVGTKGINVNERSQGTVYGPKGFDPATAKEREIILARGQRSWWTRCTSA